MTPPMLNATIEDEEGIEFTFHNQLGRTRIYQTRDGCMEVLWFDPAPPPPAPARPVVTPPPVVKECATGRCRRKG